MAPAKVLDMPPEEKCTTPANSPVPDAVEKASEDSFPASDPPAWIATPCPTETAETPTLRIALKAKKAIDFMTTNVISIPGDSTLLEASVLLTDKGLNAVPVIDSAGKPIGVISQSDLLIHTRENLQALAMKLGHGAAANPLPMALTPQPEPAKEKVYVRDVMTPGVYTVASDTPAPQVIKELLSMNVHQVFVVDEAGVLVAAVCAMDILKHLQFDE